MSNINLPEKASLHDLFKNRSALKLMSRMMLTRVAGAGFATTIPTLVAIQSNIAWLPFSNETGLTGLAALGIIAAAGSAGGLLANSVGHKLVEIGGVKINFRVSALLQLIMTIAVALIIVFFTITNLGIIGLAIIMFVFSLFSPGLAGLARAWWHEIGLNETLAKRGGFLEPNLSAIAWSVGPTIAAPLVILTPWAIVVFGILSAIGLLLLSSLPTPYQKEVTPKPKPTIAERHKNILRAWWMPFTYSFYHIARALLNAGSTAVLVNANQQNLIGAASASPSIGHTVAGVLFASKKNVHDGLRKAVMLGLLGQAAPTLLVALFFFLNPEPNIIFTILVVVGGGFVIGLLKAPVASAIYPLASDARPEDGLGLTTSRITNGMIIGGLVGPLLGTLIVSTVGATWLLPASVIALIICAAGVLLDKHVAKMV